MELQVNQNAMIQSLGQKIAELEIQVAALMSVINASQETEEGLSEE